VAGLVVGRRLADHCHERPERPRGGEADDAADDDATS
jgi:hypothetical protein